MDENFTDEKAGVITRLPFILVALALSISILVTALQLAEKECEVFLQWPLIAIGVLLLLFSLSGFLCSSRVYLALSVSLCFTIIALTVFALVITHKGAGQFIPGRAYKEYRLGDYSDWLQKRVEKTSNWNQVKRCMMNSNICNKLGVDSGDRVDKEFYKWNLSPIQSGCCKPPTSCNFGYVNATYWTPTEGIFPDMDCSRWSNEVDQLCYDCDSCKAGVLARLKDDWHKIAVDNSLLVILLVVIYPILFSVTLFLVCGNSQLHRCNMY